MSSLLPTPSIGRVMFLGVCGGVFFVIGGCASAPDCSNSPASGGLAGYVMGEYRGDYDCRAQERGNRLKILETERRRLDEQNKRADYAVDDQRRENSELKSRLQTLSDSIVNLKHRIAAAQSSLGNDHAKKITLENKLKDLEIMDSAAQNQLRYYEKQQQDSKKEAQLRAKIQAVEKERDLLIRMLEHSAQQ